MNRKLLLIGGGGHCKVVLDSLLFDHSYTEIAIIDQAGNVGRNIMGIPILGCDDDLEELYRDGYQYAFLSLGSIGHPDKRIKLYSTLERIGFSMPNIIDATASVSKHAELNHGIYIGKQAVVNPGVVLGKGVIINTAAVVEHDCSVEEFVHISPGSVLCGGVSVGKNTNIGAGSVIKQQVKVGINCIIGMGSVVLHNINDSMMAYGNPCREVKSL